MTRLRRPPRSSPTMMGSRTRSRSSTRASSPRASATIAMRWVSRSNGTTAIRPTSAPSRAIHQAVLCQGCQGHPGAWIFVFTPEVDAWAATLLRCEEGPLRGVCGVSDGEPLAGRTPEGGREGRSAHLARNQVVQDLRRREVSWIAIAEAFRDPILAAGLGQAPQPPPQHGVAPRPDPRTPVPQHLTPQIPNPASRRPSPLAVQHPP